MEQESPAQTSVKTFLALTKNQLLASTFVYKNCSFELDNNRPFALVGPLNSDCLMIVSNRLNAKVLIIHTHGTYGAKNIYSLLTSKERYTSSNMRIQLYTTQKHTVKKRYSNNFSISLTDTWKTLLVKNTSIPEQNITSYMIPAHRSHRDYHCVAVFWDEENRKTVQYNISRDLYLVGRQDIRLIPNSLYLQDTLSSTHHEIDSMIAERIENKDNLAIMEIRNNIN